MVQVPDREELKRLLRLPSTAEAEEKLRQAEAKYAVPSKPEHARWYPEMLQMHRENLELCPRRDAIHATRPDGCWCLGLGGNGEYVFDLPDGTKVEAFKEYCDCQEGQEAEARMYLAQERKNFLLKAEAARTAWAKAEIPARFKDFRLENSPLKATMPKLIDRLTWPRPPADDAAEDVWDAWGDRFTDWEASWYFWGAYGTGKTGLAVGYGREYMRRVATDEKLDYLRARSHVLFRTVPDLLSELRDTYRRDDVSEADVIGKYTNVGLLILDDLGAEQVTGSGWVEDRLYQIVGGRHAEERLTVFTSNLSVEKLAKRIGERVTWRIVEMCGAGHIIKVTGPNLRDKADAH